MLVLGDHPALLGCQRQDDSSSAQISRGLHSGMPSIYHPGRPKQSLVAPRSAWKQTKLGWGDGDHDTEDRAPSTQ